MHHGQMLSLPPSENISAGKDPSALTVLHHATSALATILSVLLHFKISFLTFLMAALARPLACGMYGSCISPLRLQNS